MSTRDLAKIAKNQTVMVVCKPAPEKLTGKQTQFVQGILKGLSQSDAYREAYDCENMADNSIWREAMHYEFPNRVTHHHLKTSLLLVPMSFLTLPYAYGITFYRLVDNGGRT
jgi:hypothetical protein